MKRVAIPVFNGQLSEYFGQCSDYEIFEIENGHVKSEEVEIPPTKDITQLPEWAASKGITDIITYKIDNRIINLFIPLRINLFIGITINTPSNLIDDYINGKLKSNEIVISEIMTQNESYN
jgi:predicted Fe-Mo cluster-binding NifX family protein